MPPRHLAAPKIGGAQGIASTVLTVRACLGVLPIFKLEIVSTYLLVEEDTHLMVAVRV